MRAVGWWSHSYSTGAQPNIQPPKLVNVKLFLTFWQPMQLLLYCVRRYHDALEAGGFICGVCLEGESGPCRTHSLVGGAFLRSCQVFHEISQPMQRQGLHTLVLLLLAASGRALSRHNLSALATCQSVL